MALPHRSISKMRHHHALTRTATAITTSCLRPAPLRSLNSNTRFLLVQTRTKRSSSASKKNEKKIAIASALRANNEAASRSSSGGGAVADADGPIALVYGLHPVNYAAPPPIRKSPPPPPPKPGLQKHLWPFTLLFTGATVGYFYMNNKNDNFAYWEAMQSGEALRMDDDDDDEDDEEWEEYDEVEDMAVEGGGNLSQLPLDDTVSGENQEGIKQRKGWFSWINGWRRGNKGHDGSDSPGR